MCTPIPPNNRVCWGAIKEFILDTAFHGVNTWMTAKSGSTTAEKKTAIAKKKTAKKKWVKTVTTDSTHPPHDLFTKSAAVIARSLASKKVSPKGAASGMRMLTYYINRAGKNLSSSRKEELEKAKQLLSKKIQQQKEPT